MPKRTDIKSILILGAGPIVIGQACEFDYSGAQACKALREEGYRVILVNSNPATIMTDPEMADATYIEPIHWEVVRKIIEKERPDAVLPTMGGQTALNCALELERQGVLEEFGVTMIGATADAIDKAEDRRRFDVAMKKIGLETARSGIAHTMEEALAVAADVGFPCIIRPSFTMGGSGGGIAYNREEFEEICARGLDLSPTKELLIDESLIGWKEYEMEVVRDKNDNCIIVCSIENFDAMGIHTGDSITVAPAQTLTDKEYQIMRNASMAVLREIGVETGGSNVQFAVNPKNGRLIVIEMNPRVSRSSALASKATGFPIAKVAAKLAVGYTLDELMNDITGGRTPASFEPSIDYVVTKIPRFNFEKFAGANDRLTTQMKSVGEVMAIGRTQQESLQKALRGLEVGATGFDPKVSLDDPEALTKIRRELKDAGAERIWYIADAFRAGLSVDGVFNLTNIDRWFLVQIEELVRLEEKVAEVGITGLNAEFLRQLKRKGFADARLAKLAGVREAEIRKLRDGEALYCTNPNCSAQRIQALSHFVSRDAMNMEGLSEETLKKFLEKGFVENYPDLFRLEKHQAEITAMEGFGEKSYQNLIASVEKAKSAELPNFIYALGINHVGLRNAKLLCREFDYDLEKIKAATEDALVQVEGFGEIIAHSIAYYFRQEAHLALLADVLQYLSFQAAEQAEVGESPLAGLTFVVTGDLEQFANRKELQALIEKGGGKVTGSVTKKTNFLINNDIHSASSKNKKAAELGISILSEQDFIDKFLK